MSSDVIYEFDPDKNLHLKQERGISFEEIICFIEDGYVIDILEHPNQQRYAGQRIYVIDIDGYLYLVPFVKNGNHIFLKTLFPSRKATKEYKRNKEWLN